jgi:hypothetical protein
MNIVIDGRTIQDHFPGIARYTFNLARALAQVAPEDTFSLLFDPTRANTRYDLGQLQAYPNVRLVPAAAGVFSLSAQWRIPRQISALRPDVIHAPYYIRPYALPAPVVLTAHDVIPLRYPAYFTLRERLIFRTAMTLALRTARATIAVSECTAQDLRCAFDIPTKRLFVVSEAADPAFTPQPASAIAAARAAYR